MLLPYEDDIDIDIVGGGYQRRWNNDIFKVFNEMDLLKRIKIQRLR